MNPTNQHTILPISFPVDLVGITKEATVIEDLSDIESFKYKVRFEDGTEDVFTIIEGPEILIEPGDPGHEHYANALLKDLYILSSIEPGVFFYMLPMQLATDLVNVWLVEMEPRISEKECISISYNQKIQFELFLTNDEKGWRYRGMNGPLTIAEKRLANDLTATMETIRNAIQFLRPPKL